LHAGLGSSDDGGDDTAALNMAKALRQQVNTDNFASDSSTSLRALNNFQ
jgi:hypothetical protein